VAGELNISPGNLYYHYPAKEELINKLYEGYETELGELLHASEGIHDVEDAWFFMHSLFELIWRHRFLYRDLNDLLSKNRHLETQFQLVLKHKVRAMRQLIAGLGRAGHLEIDAHEVDTLAQSMVVVLTYWLSYEYVRNPRQALEQARPGLGLGGSCPGGGRLGLGPVVGRDNDELLAGSDQAEGFPGRLLEIGVGPVVVPLAQFGLIEGFQPGHLGPEGGGLLLVAQVLACLGPDAAGQVDVCGQGQNQSGEVEGLHNRARV